MGVSSIVYIRLCGAPQRMNGIVSIDMDSNFSRFLVRGVEHVLLLTCPFWRAPLLQQCIGICGIKMTASTSSLFLSNLFRVKSPPRRVIVVESGSP